jgi:hypothetical protein
MTQKQLRKTDKTDEGVDDMTEQAPVLTHRGVYKRNLVMDPLSGGVYNMDNTSDNPTCNPWGIEVWTSDKLDKQ